MTQVIVKTFGPYKKGKLSHVIHLEEIYGTSTETKPVMTIATGSIFVEVDTGDIYLFNGDTGEWVKQFSLKD